MLDSAPTPVTEGLLSEVAGARIVVTGGAGLIGQPTVQLLAELGAQVISFDVNPLPPSPAAPHLPGATPPGVTEVIGDLRDATEVRRVIQGADAVVHLGGIPGLNIVDDVSTYQINAVGTFTVFEAAAAAGVRKVVYASSINANGLPIGKLRAPTVIPYSESEPAAISDAYSLSKEANERAAVMAAARWGLALTGIRFPLVRDLTVQGGAVFAEHLRRMLRDDPVRQGYEGWSYLDAGDAARAVLCALSRSTPPAPGILVAAPLTYLRDDTRAALRAVLPEVPVGELSGRAVGLDLRLAEELLGFAAELLLEDIDPGLLASVLDAEEAAR